MDENIMSFKNLEKNLELAGYDIKKIPLIKKGFLDCLFRFVG